MIHKLIVPLPIISPPEASSIKHQRTELAAAGTLAIDLTPGPGKK